MEIDEMGWDIRRRGELFDQDGLTGNGVRRWLSYDGRGRDVWSSGLDRNHCRGLTADPQIRVGVSEREHAAIVVIDHVAIVGAMRHLDQPDRFRHLVGCLIECPSTILGAIGNLDHRGPIQAVMAMEEDRVILGVGKNPRGVIQQIAQCLGVGGAALGDDWNVNPTNAQLLGECALAHRERMVIGMSQREDRPDLAVADDPPHWPAFLPGSAIDLARLHDRELPGENIVVTVPPSLLGPQQKQADC